MPTSTAQPMYAYGPLIVGGEFAYRRRTLPTQADYDAAANAVAGRLVMERLRARADEGARASALRMIAETGETDEPKGA